MTLFSTGPLNPHQSPCISDLSIPLEDIPQLAVLNLMSDMYKDGCFLLASVPFASIDLHQPLTLRYEQHGNTVLSSSL